MKLFCFLTSLIFVNVSSDAPADYKRNIANTNAYVKQAFGRNIVEPGSVESVLEKVIKNIIGDVNTYSLEAILNMVAIPDTPYLGNFEESATNQTVLREIIENEYNIKVPQVPESHFRRLTLNKLGDRRRAHTRQALINIFHMDVVGSEELFTELWICRLTALFVSTNFPTKYIRHIDTDTDECTTSDGFVIETYRKVGGEWRYFVDNKDVSSLEALFV
ncbi:uncharacterized protein LOC126834153 [Adelges cooleyi]|uniref:uncharacterized protein LOC126834153 n=1 Tax=Adelges cooleyi TaxID=133065 RepID=UPI0021806D2C|nr:uncharacterized protein LOC126834153 [Adelges cooleyi]